MTYVKDYFIAESSLSSKPHNKLTTKVTTDAIVRAYVKLSSRLIIYVESPLPPIVPIPLKNAKRPVALPYEFDST